ncbi:hypothetical protein [Peredibacter starrii]|uniref:Uncharacterized protein n=1 Tax=Peredibacter starrii TaxID=28202 RepID=A0AAX4HVS5_9BACT|nr:hypothetical protein [Peredibacter starrii]WPU67111.1 hypothetical protein SOO65_10130 [Peredibacter starrii]
MKFLTLVFAVLCIAQAQAAETVVLEVPKNSWARELKAVFEVNKDNGRAWVSLNFREQFGGSGSRRDAPQMSVSTRVAGLSYDTASQNIIFEQDGALTECASVRTRGVSIFRHDNITMTGCKLKVRHVKKMVDNGYEVRKEDRTQVLLITNN